MPIHRVAMRIVLRGRVQGIGIRPTIARLARQWNLQGFVRNCPEGVEVATEGDPAVIEAFQAQLAASLPNDTARHSTIYAVSAPLPDPFSIEPTDGAGALSTPVPADINVCTACLDDARASNNRRYQYPFTSCTACGPRYSIIRAMPYDRAATSMDQFSLCPQCTDEYKAAADRRFHAQTNACSACGPSVWCCDADGRTLARDQEAVTVACQAIQAGQIVALKGIGGYLLLADATSEAAVATLRARKHRPAKPLAVMVADLPAAQSLARLSPEERRQLISPAGPIVIAPALPNNGLAAGLHPGLGEIGLMLPATVLHDQIARQCGPVVATSGNLEGDPLEFEPAAAVARLGNIAGLFLHHDRPIERPIDDSVVRVTAGRPVTIRLARGLAPRGLDLPDTWKSDRHIVALGGEQKSAMALYNGHQAALGPHLGDLSGIAGRERFVSQLESLKQLYRIEEPLFVTDQHPDYFTTVFAQERCGECMAVQHHHAHLAAAMLEHGWLDREVLGVVWDGTGYGADGTVWGGEFLLGTAGTGRRVAHLRPFRLFGGDVAIHEPRRVAASLLADTFGADDAVRITRQLGWSGDEVRFAALSQKPQLGVATTSAGRLFDAVAAIALGISRAEFEGQPAMLLESACDPTDEACYALPITDDQPPQLDWRSMIRSIWGDVQRGAPPGAIAMRFHRSLATAIEVVCQRYSDQPVALCGGVFQNRVLVELVADQFHSHNQPLGLPGDLPPNDGGLAAGQLTSALSRLISDRQR